MRMTETNLNIGTSIDSINLEPVFVTYRSDAFYMRKSIFCLAHYRAGCSKMFYLFVSVNVIRLNSLLRFSLISSFYSKWGYKKKKFIVQYKTIGISIKQRFPYFHSAEKFKLNTTVKQNVIAKKVRRLMDAALHFKTKIDDINLDFCYHQFLS